MLISVISLTDVSIRIRQRTESGYGDWWDIDSGEFTPSQPALFALTQDLDDNNLYATVLAAIETYSGKLEVFVYQLKDSVYSLLDSTTFNLADGVPTDAVTLAGGSPPPATDLSLLEVPKSMTWFLRPGASGWVASNAFTVLPGASEWYSFDLSCPLGPNDSIEGVSAVVDVASLASVDEYKIAANRREVHAKIGGFNAGNESTIKATVTTAQGRTIVAQGVITVE